MTEFSAYKGKKFYRLPVVDRLTPTEQKVAEFLGEGMTNRQIAEAIGWKYQSIGSRILIVKEKLKLMRCEHENSNR